MQGVTLDAAFAAPTTNPAPPPLVVKLLNGIVQRVVQLWLDSAGVPAAAGFSLVSTPFAANGSGLDKVLDRTTVNLSTGELTLTDGTTTQTSKLSVSGGSITVTTTTTGPGGTSTSTSSTVVPTQTAQQTALTEIAQAFVAFAGTVNGKGAALQASDLLPYLDPAGLDDGLDQGQWAALWAVRLAGQNLAFSDITLTSFGADASSNPVAEVACQIAVGPAGQASTMSQRFTLRKTGGAWLLYGNRRIASLEVRSSMVTNQGTVQNSGPVIEVNVSAPHGTVSGATCSGGGLWSGTPMVQGSSKVEGTLVLDGFQVYNPSLATLPPAGTPFTVVVQPAGGGAPVSYTAATNATTTEAIRITNLTGAALADAHLGTALAVTWTLPKTFPIALVRLSQAAYTGEANAPGTFECETEVPGSSTSSTSGQVNIPTTCHGLPTVLAYVYLNVTGMNGEVTMVYYGFR